MVDQGMLIVEEQSFIRFSRKQILSQDILHNIPSLPTGTPGVVILLARSAMKVGDCFPPFPLFA